VNTLYGTLALAGALTMMLAAAAAGSEAAPAEPAKPRVIPFGDRYEARVYKSAQGESLPYRLLKPRPYDPAQAYPLVLFLHGMGERGSDNEAQLVNGVSEWLGSDAAMAQYPCFVVVPQCPDGEDSEVASWSNWRPGKPAITTPTRLALEAVTAIQQEFHIDPDRLYIGGLSMGGFGTWNVIAEYPDRFAAAAVICGGGDLTKASRIASIPVWIFHGNRDEAVPVKLSRDMFQALLDAGGSPGYTEYPEVGHASWVPALQDAQLLRWLFAQKRVEGQ
jgi:predicted peptidase